MLQSEMVMSSQTITHAAEQYYLSLWAAAIGSPEDLYCILYGLYYVYSV